jgi:hypothetical protein
VYDTVIRDEAAGSGVATGVIAYPAGYMPGTQIRYMAFTGLSCHVDGQVHHVFSGVTQR